MKRIVLFLLIAFTVAGCAGQNVYGRSGDSYYYPEQHQQYYGQNNSMVGSAGQLRNTACRAWGTVANNAWNSSTYTYACVLSGVLGL